MRLQSVNQVDLIILDLDGGEMLQACLASIEGQTVTPRSVIVWDNGSAIPVAERVASDYSFTLIIQRSEKNQGFTGGINRAMDLVTAPYVGWINNDALLDSAWVEVLTETLDSESKLGAVQTRIRRDSRMLDGAGIEIDRGTFVQAGHLAPINSYVPARPAWGVSATAALYKVAALREVAIGARVLHPDFFAWYEDVELCARLHEGGWRTAVLPQLLATHAGSRSAVVIGGRAMFLRTRNRYWTARLHPGVGRIRSLLIEDFRKSLRAILRARFAHVVHVMRGAWAGLTAKI